MTTIDWIGIIYIASILSFTIGFKIGLSVYKHK